MSDGKKTVVVGAVINSILVAMFAFVIWYGAHTNAKIKQNFANMKIEWADSDARDSIELQNFKWRCVWWTDTYPRAYVFDLDYQDCLLSSHY